VTPVKVREILTWKFLFYHVLLPVLRRLGTRQADAVLAGFGRVLAVLWPPYARRLAAAVAGCQSLIVGHQPSVIDYRSSAIDHQSSALDPGALAAGVMRFLARDYLLETDDDDEALARFAVSGAGTFEAAVADGHGAVLVGSHLGGHIAALHWLYRRGVPLRLMVQRPRHVASALNRFFDRDEPEPQAGFFLRRSLEPAACITRLVRARAALRAGKVVYLPGDIPWSGPNTHAGRLLGRAQQFLSVWADLAALTGAPVFFVFCTHAPGGRFALTLEPAGLIVPGQENSAVAGYLSRLEAEIAAHPSDAVAHLLWPCYSATFRAPLPLPPRSARRPSRRVAVFPQA
jgi:lauroyl/myristoyl acyltransferase